MKNLLDKFFTWFFCGSKGCQPRAIYHVEGEYVTLLWHECSQCRAIVMEGKLK